MWGGRFSSRPADIMQAINASIDVDRRLWREDILGSKAHAAMLAAQGIITKDDAAKILAGLDQIAAARRLIVMAVLDYHGKERQPMETWHASDRVRVNRVAAELASLSDSGEIGLAKIAVAAGILSDLAAQHRGG